MPELIDPDGQHTWVAPETAEQLLEEGWRLLAADGPSASEPEPEDNADADVDDDETLSPPDDDEQAPPAPENENPLGTIKLKELIEHAEKIGVPAEQLDPLRKPGASKAEALAIIAAHTAS